MIVTLVALLPLPPLLQDQNYHQFADQRELFGVPNFWNVVSNLPFIAVGAIGLAQIRRDATTFVLFAGIFLTSFGSSYYHLNPNDDTLYGGPFCETMRQTLPPWTCSWSRPLTSNCCTAS